MSDRYDIFVSYAREDRERVRPIVEALHRRWPVFWDERIRATERWDRSIDSHLASCHCVVVVWSKQSVHSEWVAAEASEAKAHDKLLPVKIDEVKPPTEFTRRQTVDLTGWNNDLSHPGFQRLAADIAAQLPVHCNAIVRGEYDFERDRDNYWHYLDKRKLKKRFDSLWLSPEMVKVLFIEYDPADRFSLSIHEILHSYHKADEPLLGNVKGAPDRDLDLEDSEFLREKWLTFMKREFSLPGPSFVPEVFGALAGSQSCFVVQSVVSFDVGNFRSYYDFWQSLDLQKPVFLFFYVNADLFSRVPEGGHVLRCALDEHRFVTRDDFATFFSTYRDIYQWDAELCNGDDLTFQQAVEKLTLNRAVNPYF